MFTQISRCTDIGLGDRSAAVKPIIRVSPYELTSEIREQKGKEVQKNKARVDV